MNLIQVGFDCLSDLDTNVKDGYECNDGLWIWYRLGLIVYLIWILMLRMDKNVMMDCECDTGWNVEEDGYECYDGLSIWYRLGLIVYLILDTNVKDGYECHDIWSGY